MHIQTWQLKEPTFRGDMQRTVLLKICVKGHIDLSCSSAYKCKIFRQLRGVLALYLK